MPLYNWKGTAFECPLTSLRAETPISIICDVEFDRLSSVNPYIFKPLYIRLSQLNSSKFMVIPLEFFEEILDVEAQDLSSFLEKQHNEGNLNICEVGLTHQ